MASFRCKRCGGNLEVEIGTSVAGCDSCGMQQTVPMVSEEGRHANFNRAIMLRIKGEFDDAAKMYDRLIEEDDSDPEAYWGRLLSVHGVEYGEDPDTHKKLMLCRRPSAEFIVNDPDYEMAISHADTARKTNYESEARAIDENQKQILNYAKSAKPYDVFLCYKNKDVKGGPSKDSMLANDIYNDLTEEGFNVFSVINTLVDTPEREYEKYIYQGLVSAKVMLVIGARPEYFKAPWVRNEWSRYLQFMKTDGTKHIIPCYQDVDLYDLPEEFVQLPARNITDPKFKDEIVADIKKCLSAPAVVLPVGDASDIPALINKGHVALENGKWDEADKIFEDVLQINPDYAEAHLGKFMAKSKQKPSDREKPQEQTEDVRKKELARLQEQADRIAAEIDEQDTISLTRKPERTKSSAPMVAIIVVVLLLLIGGGIAFWQFGLPAVKYNQAKSLKDQGKYEEAIKAFEAMGNYSDAAAQREQIVASHPELSKVGDTITFGQGNQEWVILAKEDGKVLLLSKYCIARRAYNAQRESVTWETSDIREWLNSSYLDVTFSDLELPKIVEVDNENNDNEQFGTAGGNNTKDKIFLLSIDDVNTYFPEQANRVSTMADGSSAWWLLRSPGSGARNACFVDFDGSIDMSGHSVLHVYGAIRPALWVNFSGNN